MEKEKNFKKEISNYTGQLEALSERLAKLPVDVPADEIYKTMKVLGEKRDRVSSELDGLLKGSEIGCEVPVELKDYKSFLKAIKALWFNPKSSSELKEKIVRKIIARIEIDTDKVYVEYWVGKGHFRREINSLPSPQVPETPHFLKNVGSRTCHNGAQDWRAKASKLFIPKNKGLSNNFIELYQFSIFPVVVCFHLFLALFR